jgi:hypothetical protein
MGTTISRLHLVGSIVDFTIGDCFLALMLSEGLLIIKWALGNAVLP